MRKVFWMSEGVWLLGLGASCWGAAGPLAEGRGTGGGLTLGVGACGGSCANMGCATKHAVDRSSRAGTARRITVFRGLFMFSQPNFVDLMGGGELSGL